MANSIILTAVYSILSIVSFVWLYKMVNKQRNLEQNVHYLEKQITKTETDPA